MLTALFTQFAPYIVGIIGVIAGVFGIYVGGKKAGKAEVQSAAVKAKAAETMAEAKTIVEQATATAKGVTDVQSDINKLNSGDAASRLRDEWNREEPAASPDKDH
uniref:Endolysin-like protein n=1 Tax=Pseudomonas phage Pavpe01 TaxID=3138545 RepID=A0AAU6W176_9VIRU